MFNNWRCLLAMFRGATERKQHTNKLEMEVLERTKELHHINQALKESEQRYHLLLSISPVAIFHLDTKGNCLYANAQFTAFTGLTTEEAYAGGGWEKSIHPDDLERVTNRWYEATANDRLFQAEYRFCKHDGSIVRVFAQTSSVKGEDGVLTGFIGTFTNITKQYELAKKIQLQQQQLARIGRLNAMAEVASNLAHELNQPLAVISSYAQQLEQKLIKSDFEQEIRGDETIKKITTKIVKNTHRATNVVKSMRNLCTSGLVKKEREKINELILDSVQMVNSKSLGSNFVRYHLIAPSPVITVDKVQIRQLLINLVQNAVDAMIFEPKHPPQVTITTSIENKFLNISVIDTGPGFPPDIRDNLFQPFFTTKSKGMGIGLAICRSIIEAHGGELTATSNDGKGAKFSFTLPLPMNKEEEIR